MPVNMRMGAGGAAGVRVAMGGDEPYTFEQGDVVQDLKRRTLANETAFFQHDAAIGNFLQAVEIVGSGHDGLLAAAPGGDEIDDLVLAARIERAGRLVEKNHFGIQDQHRSQGNALALAAGKLMGGAIAQRSNVHGCEHLLDAVAQGVARPLQLQRAEGYLVEDGGIEELHVGILKYQADAAAELKREGAVMETGGADLLAGEREGSRIGKGEAIENA